MKRLSKSERVTRSLGRVSLKIEPQIFFDFVYVYLKGKRTITNSCTAKRARSSSIRINPLTFSSHTFACWHTSVSFACINNAVNIMCFFFPSISSFFCKQKVEKNTGTTTLCLPRARFSGKCNVLVLACAGTVSGVAASPSLDCCPCLDPGRIRVRGPADLGLAFDVFANPSSDAKAFSEEAETDAAIGVEKVGPPFCIPGVEPLIRLIGLYPRGPLACGVSIFLFSLYFFELGAGTTGVEYDLDSLLFYLNKWSMLTLPSQDFLLHEIALACQNNTQGSYQVDLFKNYY